MDGPATTKMKHCDPTTFADMKCQQNKAPSKGDNRLLYLQLFDRGYCKNFPTSTRWPQSTYGAKLLSLPGCTESASNGTTMPMKVCRESVVKDPHRLC